MWHRRRTPDADGFAESRDEFGRTEDEAAAEFQALMERSYQVVRRSDMVNAPFLGIRRIGTDPDGFPVYGRPW